MSENLVRIPAGTVVHYSGIPMRLVEPVVVESATIAAWARDAEPVKARSGLLARLLAAL